jgi:hypothetical protein
MEPNPAPIPEDLPLVALPGVRRYSKALTALVLVLIGWATLVVTSDPGGITAEEWLTLGSGLVVSGGVFTVPNTRPTVPAPN